MEKSLIRKELFTKEHSEYDYERGNFQKIIFAIEKLVDLKKPTPTRKGQYWEKYGGADEDTSVVLAAREFQQFNDLNLLASEPYFGRLVFIDEEGKEVSVYIGKQLFENDDIRIISWMSPIGSLFSRHPKNEKEKSFYFTPGKQRLASLHLKRHFDFTNRDLAGIFDEYDFRTRIIGSQQRNQGDKLLSAVLQERGEVNLQDIVRTIQEEQDELIRTDPKGYLIINGVAGSGKTSIAFHRVAYLLYTASQEKKSSFDQSDHASNIIIFGPSQLFMSYVRGLLPGLGVRGVNQTSFDSWALEQMHFVELFHTTTQNGSQIEKKSRLLLIDTSTQSFLDRGASKQLKKDLWLRSRYKGRMQYMHLLDRYLNFRMKKWNYLPFAGEVNIEGFDSQQIHIDSEEIKEIHLRFQNQDKPFNEIRNLIIGELKKIFLQKYDLLINNLISKKQSIIDQKWGLNVQDVEEIKKLEYEKRVFIKDYLGVEKERIINGLIGELREFLSQNWPAIDHYNDYYRLLSSRDMLVDLAKGLFSDEEVEILLQTQKKNGLLDIEDLAGMMYLYIKANGKGESNFGHIVVDEAQDFSPLHYAILKMYNPSRSMTIVGDINQGIYAHRGLHDWGELKSILGEIAVVQKDVYQSYRATREITNFSNAVLERRSKGLAKLPIPFNRPGEKPVIIESPNTSSMYRQIANDIKEINKKGFANIGILVKQAADVDLVFSQLFQSGLSVSRTMNRDDEFNYQGGNLIIPVDLSKGIEFEAVLVIGADSENYDPDIDYDGRLLYVAVTRALHILRIYSVGHASPYLDKAKNL